MASIKLIGDDAIKNTPGRNLQPPSSVKRTSSLAPKSSRRVKVAGDSDTHSLCSDRGLHNREGAPQAAGLCAEELFLKLQDDKERFIDQEIEKFDQDYFKTVSDLFHYKLNEYLEEE